MAQYRLLVDHFVDGHLLEAGSIVRDGPGGLLPSGWIPTIGCDPIDADGMQKLFDAGPTGAMGSAEHGSLSIVMNGNRWAGVPVGPPVHYWKSTVVDGVKVWVVNGAENLGWKDDV
jgi:hypothetical protein